MNKPPRLDRRREALELGQAGAVSTAVHPLQAVRDVVLMHADSGGQNEHAQFLRGFAAVRDLVRRVALDEVVRHRRQRALSPWEGGVPIGPPDRWPRSGSAESPMPSLSVGGTDYGSGHHT